MIGFNSFSSLFELLEAFPTEQSCIEYLEMLRWGEKVESPLALALKCMYVEIIHIYVRTPGDVLM